MPFLRCRFLALVGLMCVIATWTSSAWAHEAGLSRGRYELALGRLDAHLTFANAELANALPAVDSDANGTISSAELAAGATAVRRDLAERFVVSADGIVCPISTVSAHLTEQDGIGIDIVVDCATMPAKLALHCGFLEILSSSHHHVAIVSVEGRDMPETIVVVGNTDVVVDLRTAPRPTNDFLGFVRLGVEHILTGYDHLVFLLGLILLGGRARSLVAALTAFTVAHSLSLALAVLRLWMPRPALIEPAIALSIAYVGLENIVLLRRQKQTKHEAWVPTDPASGRWRITFPFGLIHGFGFAGALVEIGLPRARASYALLAFNIGVELGQLAVLALVFPLLVWARRFPAVMEPATKYANFAIVAAGMIWFVLRVIAI